MKSSLREELMQLGGAEGNRTPDLDIANVALSQLSYSPANWRQRNILYQNSIVKGIRDIRFTARHVSRDSFVQLFSTWE